MKKSRLLKKNVRNALIQLYLVSHLFNPEQYEDYVRATHMYLSYYPNSVLTACEISAYDALSRLVSAFPEKMSHVNTNFYVL